VTIVAHRSEMGTGSRTNLPMVLADEMEADWTRVRIVQAPGDEPRYGNQDTDGSRSLRHFVQPMRQCGAAVRHMLEAAAAKQWGVEPKLARARNHEVVLLKAQVVAEGVHYTETDKRLGFGELAAAAMQMPVPPFEALRFKTDAEFRYIGKGQTPLYDLHDITTGKAVYGADIRLPGMKHAVVARPPVVGGKVKSYDAKAALAVPGVERVVEIASSMPPAKFAPLGGIAVVANSTWAALQGRDQLQIAWEDGPHAVYTTETYRAEMSATAKKPGKVIRAQGDAERAFANAAKVVSAEYYQPHMAHISMEPPVAVARIDGGKVEIWGPVQSPYGTRQDVAKTLGVKEEDVTVNVTLLGGGFGRKSKCDFVLEAALVAKAVGAPVKLQWTREDDIRHAFYHTTSVERIEAAVDAAGKVTGWRHRSVAPSILSTFAPDSGYQFFIEYGMGLVDMPFSIANVSCENGQAMAHTRIGWFRSVSNVPRAFAVQSFVSELAHALGKDPKDMLLELIGPDRIINRATAGFPADHWNYGEPYDEFPIDTGRLKNVVRLAADKAGWGKTLPKGEGLGIAVHRSFVSYVASVVHVKVGADGLISVPEMHTAIDCGFCINPERVAAQIEGAAVMGMTVALYSGITFANGQVQQSNYHDYDVARMSRYPEKVHTHIVPHPFSVHATGVGEPGVPPFAPALANAIFAATGKRLRDLPFGEKVA
jgi:isoquinoline 1-oxidoreductase beta subunit